jgi:hypothetical protein
MRTFDMEFHASLADFIVYHEQFIGRDGQHLRLLSAQFDDNQADDERTLISLDFVHRARDNPSFSSSTSNSIENEIDIGFSKMVVILKLEALLSIMRFQETVTKKLAKATPTNEPTSNTNVKRTGRVVRPIDGNIR